MSEWMKKALCKGATNAFFPPKGHSKRSHRLQDAVSTCMRCPVRKECAEEGLIPLPHPVAKIPSGVWGGLTKLERRALRNEKLMQEMQAVPTVQE